MRQALFAFFACLMLALNLPAQQSQLPFYETYEWPSAVHEDIVWGADDNGTARFLRFDASNIQVLTGTSELLKAQWFARAREQGYEGEVNRESVVNTPNGSVDTVVIKNTLTAVNATGLSMVKQVYYDGRNHRFISRISSFGPGMSEVIWKSVYDNLDARLSKEEAMRGPANFSWSARVTSRPPDRAIKFILDQSAGDVVLLEAGYGNLVLEMNVEGKWVETEDLPYKLEWTAITEDLYFDGEVFRMYSRIIETRFQDSGIEYRVRFAE